VRVAVVGLGFMGSTHIQALANVPGARLAAVVSNDEKKLAGDLSSVGGNLDRPSEKLDFSTAKKYRTAEEAFADPEIDAVDLCLPTHLHAPLTVAALRAGKHVLVEKPMALSVAETEAMLAAARESGKILMAAQVLRFWADYQPLIEAQRSRSLGAPRGFVFRRRCAAPQWGKWLQDRAKGGGGVFDLLIHDVDLCIHLFGLPQAVSAHGYEDLAAGIDLINAELHYEDVASVLVTGGWHHPKAYPFSMEYTASFQEGTIEFSTAGRAATLYNAAGEEKPLRVPAQDGFAAELAYFVECAAANRQPERCPPRESAQAVAVTLQMLESRARNGERLSCHI